MSQSLYSESSQLIYDDDNDVESVLNPLSDCLKYVQNLKH